MFLGAFQGRDAILSIERLFSFEVPLQMQIMHFQKIVPASLSKLMVNESVLTDREGYVKALEKVASKIKLIDEGNKKPDKPKTDGATSAQGMRGRGGRGRGRERGRSGRAGEGKRKKEEEEEAESGEEPPSTRRRTDEAKDALRAENFEKNRCLYCHQPGHRAKDCELANKKQTAVRATKAAEVKDEAEEESGKDSAP
jgi:hypothetical protein